MHANDNTPALSPDQMMALVRHRLRAKSPADAEILKDQLNIIATGDDLGRIKVAKTLVYQILRAEQDRLNAKGLSFTPNTFVRQDYHPLEISMLCAAMESLQLSDSYKHKMTLAANDVASAMARSKTLQYAQRHWPSMREDHKIRALQIAQHLHKKHQKLDDFQSTLSTELFFANEPYIQENGDENPRFFMATHKSGFVHLFNSESGTRFPTAKDHICTYIEYNTHNDNFYFRRSFAAAAGAMHHEQQHAFQSALALAFHNKTIDQNHPHYNDARILHLKIKEKFYIPGNILSVYRAQANEVDAFAFQTAMTRRLYRPL